MSRADIGLLVLCFSLLVLLSLHLTRGHDAHAPRLVGRMAFK